MNKEEAVEWLKGNRSWCNSINDDGQGDVVERIAKADAAAAQHAYWVLKAHKDGLL